VRLSATAPTRAPAPAATATNVAIAALLMAGLGGCGATPVESVSLTGASLANGLVAHWSFDEQNGSTVTDGIRPGHDGQIMGPSAMRAPGRFGGGLRLQAGDSVTFPMFPQATPDWTVSVWITLSPADKDALTKAALTNERAVLLSNEQPSMGGWEIEFDPRPGFEYLEASYYVGPPIGAYVILGCRCIETDRWMHFTVVFDSTADRIALYHDGLFKEGASYAPILTGEQNLDIGRWTRGERSIWGTIDDFAIWSRALTDDEIATLHVRAVPDSP